MLLNIPQLMDDAKCYEMVRELRWPDGVKCPAGDSGQPDTAPPGLYSCFP